MSKKKPAARPEKPARYSVVIDAELVPKLKMLAVAIGVKVPDWVNSRLAELVEKELDEAMKKMGYRKEDK